MSCSGTEPQWSAHKSALESWHLEWWNWRHQEVPCFENRTNHKAHGQEGWELEAQCTFDWACSMHHHPCHDITSAVQAPIAALNIVSKNTHRGRKRHLCRQHTRDSERLSRVCSDTHGWHRCGCLCTPLLRSFSGSGEATVIGHSSQHVYSSRTRVTVSIPITYGLWDWDTPDTLYNSEAGKIYILQCLGCCMHTVWWKPPFQPQAYYTATGPGLLCIPITDMAFLGRQLIFLKTERRQREDKNISTRWHSRRAWQRRLFIDIEENKRL